MSALCLLISHCLGPRAISAVDATDVGIERPTHSSAIRTHGAGGVLEEAPHVFAFVDAGKAGYRIDVPAGIDVRDVRMRYRGVDDVRVEADGRALWIRAGARVLRETGLRCFQDADPPRDVICWYRVSRVDTREFEVALDVGSYDPSAPLVIDPEISWATYLGGTGSDSAFSVALDASGGVYVVGGTESADFPSRGGLDGTLDGTADAFVARIDPEGPAIVWSSYIGGSGDDVATAVAVDGAGDVCVAGLTESVDFPIVGGFDGALEGSADAFVMKVGGKGQGVLWSSYLGGSDDDSASGLALDADGDIYLTGRTLSSDFPSSGGFDTELNGLYDTFVTKVQASGAGILWSSYLGGGEGDIGLDVGVDSKGGAYVTGVTKSSDFPVLWGFDGVFGGDWDGFVARVDATTGSLAWSSFLGGSYEDLAWSLAFDDTGVYVAGSTDSPDFPSWGAFDSTWNGEVDAFVTRVYSDGSAIEWSTFFGGAGFSSAIEVAADGVGAVYVVGVTEAWDLPTSDGFDSTLNGPDGFAAKLSRSGELAWASYLGGSGVDDAPRSVAVDQSGRAYIVGFTETSDFPTPGGFDTHLDSREGFVVCVGDASGVPTDAGGELGLDSSMVGPGGRDGCGCALGSGRGRGDRVAMSILLVAILNRAWRRRSLPGGDCGGRRREP